MAHILLPEGIPGILGPMAFSPETENLSMHSPRCFCAAQIRCPRLTER